MTDEEYIAWLLDTRTAAYRLILVELDHAGGTVRLASDDWVSDAAHGYYAYDGWLTAAITLEDELADFRGVGDIRAINPAGTPDWGTISCRGYPCRIYRGDSRWPHSDFRQIASAIIEECQPLGGALYQFDIIDGGSFLDLPAVAAEETRTGTASSVINGLLASAPTYVNVSGTRQAWNVSIDLSETTTVASALQLLAASIGAYVRVSQSGAVEIITVASTQELTITEDEIVSGGVSVIRTVPAYANVVVTYGDDQEVTRATGADTGALDETYTLDTVLTLTANADTWADEARDYHATPHPIVEVLMRDMAELVQVGMALRIEHDDFTGNGTVQSIVREPMSPFSTVELEAW